MITLFGVSLSALSPWFLVAIPCATVLLVYLFRARGIAQPRVVSSLFILRKLPSYLPSRRRFVPPFQFWLELLAFILLALAVSGILARQTGNRIAIVVDTSKSMATLQSTGDTRLQTLIRIASADIDQAQSSDRFAVFSAARVLTPHAGGDARQGLASARSARVIVEALSAGYESDRLSAVVAPLVSSREYDSVWVYTDKVLEQDVVPPTVRVVTVPSEPGSQQNVWVESVRLAAGDAAGAGKASDSSALTVTLAAVGKSPARVTLSGECFTAPGEGREALGAVAVQVHPESATQATLRPLPRNWAFCRVFAEPATSDALLLDNEAWIARATSQGSIALYSALTSQELGLNSLPYAVTKSSQPGATPEVNNAIYHRTLPTVDSPSAARLVVFPPPTRSLFGNGSVRAPQSERGRSIEVTRWIESHPILQYVQPTLLSFPTVSILSCPDTAQPVLFASEGAIACAGEYAGSRYVITGFELFPFDGVRSPTVSVLTLNIFRWLFQGAGVASDMNLAVGAVLLPYQVSRASIVAPRTEVLAESSAKSVVVTTPGILRVRREGASAQPETYLAVNAFSNEESDLSRRYTISLPALSTPRETSQASNATNRQTLPLERIFAVGLLVMLAIDLIRRIAVRASWGGPV